MNLQPNNRKHYKCLKFYFFVNNSGPAYVNLNMKMSKVYLKDKMDIMFCAK